LAGVAGESASPQQRALLSSLGDVETPAARAPEAPTPAAAATAAELAAPAVPAFALPTPAQVTQASSQAASMSGSASQRMNLVNLTMGSVQQLASMGQQGQTTAAPAEVDASASDAAPHGATLTGDAEGAGAAQGTQGAERAAVEGVRVGGDELQAGTDRHRRDL
jgi:hypothetical protein